MADVIKFTEPRIRALTLEPSPVKAKQSVTVRMSVEEVVVRILAPLPFLSGEISAGEA